MGARSDGRQEECKFVTAVRGKKIGLEMDPAKSDSHLLFLRILFCFCFIVANEMQKCALILKVIFLTLRKVVKINGASVV